MSTARNVLTRRAFVSGGLGLLAGCAAAPTPGPWSTSADRVLQIGLCHLDVRPGELEANGRRLEQSMALAAKHGATWVVTPELSVSGYHFSSRIGTDWITSAPDSYVSRMAELARELGVALWLGHVERDAETRNCFNTLYAIDDTGVVLGRHRKINTIPGSESWSTPGGAPRTIAMDGVAVGPLICADAWPPEHARALAEQGAQLLVSSANWAAAPYGPGDSWERRSAETGLPLVVCNRTGRDNGLDFATAESVVYSAGRREYSRTTPISLVIVLRLDLTTGRLLDAEEHSLPDTHRPG